MPEDDGKYEDNLGTGDKFADWSVGGILSAWEELRREEQGKSNQFSAGGGGSGSLLTPLETVPKIPIASPLANTTGPAWFETAGKGWMAKTWGWLQNSGLAQDAIASIGSVLFSHELTKPSKSEKEAYARALAIAEEQGLLQNEIVKQMFDNWQSTMAEIEGSSWSSPSYEQILAMRGEGGTSMFDKAGFDAKAKYVGGKDMGFFQKTAAKLQANQLISPAINPGAITANTNLQLGLQQNRSNQAGSLANMFSNIWTQNRQNNWYEEMLKKYGDAAVYQPQRRA